MAATATDSELAGATTGKGGGGGSPGEGGGPVESSGGGVLNGRNPRTKNFTAGAFVGGTTGPRASLGNVSNLRDAPASRGSRRGRNGKRAMGPNERNYRENYDDFVTDVIARDSRAQDAQPNYRAMNASQRKTEMANADQLLEGLSGVDLDSPIESALGQDAEHTQSTAAIGGSGGQETNETFGSATTLGEGHRNETFGSATTLGGGEPSLFATASTPGEEPAGSIRQSTASATTLGNNQSIANDTTILEESVILLADDEIGGCYGDEQESRVSGGSDGAIQSGRDQKGKQRSPGEAPIEWTQHFPDPHQSTSLALDNETLESFPPLSTNRHASKRCASNSGKRGLKSSHRDSHDVDGSLLGHFNGTGGGHCGMLLHGEEEGAFSCGSPIQRQLSNEGLELLEGDGKMRDNLRHGTLEGKQRGKSHGMHEKENDFARNRKRVRFLLEDGDNGGLDDPLFAEEKENGLFGSVEEEIQIQGDEEALQAERVSSLSYTSESVVSSNMTSAGESLEGISFVAAQDESPFQHVNKENDNPNAHAHNSNLLHPPGPATKDGLELHGDYSNPTASLDDGSRPDYVPPSLHDFASRQESELADMITSIDALSSTPARIARVCDEERRGEGDEDVSAGEGALARSLGNVPGFGPMPPRSAMAAESPLSPPEERETVAAGQNALEAVARETTGSPVGADPGALPDVGAIAEEPAAASNEPAVEPTEALDDVASNNGEQLGNTAQSNLLGTGTSSGGHPYPPLYAPQARHSMFGPNLMAARTSGPNADPVAGGGGLSCPEVDEGILSVVHTVGTNRFSDELSSGDETGARASEQRPLKKGVGWLLVGAISVLLAIYGKERWANDSRSDVLKGGNDSNSTEVQPAASTASDADAKEVAQANDTTSTGEAFRTSDRRTSYVMARLFEEQMAALAGPSLEEIAEIVRQQLAETNSVQIEELVAQNAASDAEAAHYKLRCEEWRAKYHALAEQVMLAATMALLLLLYVLFSP